jgi:outer membrane protein assembly factor BamD
MLFSRSLSLVDCIIAVTAVSCLSGCSSSQKLRQKADRSPQQMYDKAVSLMQSKKYAKAATEFDAIESQFPLSDLAAQSQLLAGYCLIKAKKYSVAVDTMDLFIDTHPTSPWIKQALYLRALGYFLNIKGLQKDPYHAKMALESFNQFLERFPRDDFSQDVTAKNQFLKEHLASHDMLIGRYYMSKSNYVSAWHHYTNMLQDWSDSVLISEIYYRIIECHVALGLASRSVRTLSMLTKHSPKSPWTKRARELLERFSQNQSSGLTTPPAPGRL